MHNVTVHYSNGTVTFAKTRRGDNKYTHTELSPDRRPTRAAAVAIRDGRLLVGFLHRRARTGD